MHEYHNRRTGVLAASLAKRAPGFPNQSARSTHTKSWHTGEISQSAVTRARPAGSQPRRLETQPLLNHKR